DVQRAALEGPHPLRHARRVTARGLRRAVAERLLHGHEAVREARPRGVPGRRLPAHARSVAHGRRVGGDGLAGGRGARDRASLAADAGVPHAAVFEDRAEREAARAAHPVRARALRRARHPEIRERGAVRLTGRGAHGPLKRIAPWAVTLVIFAVLFWKIPFARVVEALEGAQWGRFVLLMAPYSLFYCAIDAAVVLQAVSWFNVPVRYADVFPIRATTYILTLLNSQLGQGGLAVFLHKRYGLPFWQITGTVLVLLLVEMYQLALYSFLGATLTGELGRSVSPWPYVVLAAYLVFHLWFFSKPRGG